MVSRDDAPRVETKAEAEALIPQFSLTKVLNQDQNGRRITLLGLIQDKDALLTIERAAFPSDNEVVAQLLTSLSNTKNLGANDVYRWYMSNTRPVTTSSILDSSAPSTARLANSIAKTMGVQASPESISIPDVKINVIWPATESHIKKYTTQRLRLVTETPLIYKEHVRPHIMRTQRTQKRLDWIYNILDGRTEQEDVVYRSPSFGQFSAEDKSDSEGFLLLPDLNWDRKTVTGTHLLALVERRNIWSLRDLQQKHVPWLKNMRKEITKAAAQTATKLAREAQSETSILETIEVDEDEFKCYVHYHPTYWHFHIHVVHVMLEAEGSTQSAGKAILLDNLIAQLDVMDGGKGMDEVAVSYFVGEESDVWKKCFVRLKRGESITLNEDA